MKPIVLCIMDGCAIRKEEHGNAFLKANKPNFDKLMREYSHSLLEASGESVGLPSGQMGNSEVGHMNIGAGRVVYQPLVRIDKSIENQTFFKNENILEVINHVKKNSSKLHIMGLLSDGGIHSHINHLLALIDLCKKENVDTVYFHMFLDGRDTLPACARKYLDILSDKIKEVGFGSIATLSGRYYAMDRDNNWDRIEKAYQAIVYGKGEEYSDYNEALTHNYENKIEDEFIIPAVLDKNGTLKENDGIILFNYRPDRIRELFKAITNPSFDSFFHEKFKNVPLVTMMPLSEEVICKNAFLPQTMENTLGFYLSSLGKKQLRIAETEKYAHVTYFFDGGVDTTLNGCTRILIPSPKVATYDLKPEMSAYEITDALLTELDKDIYDVVILNFANGDMVGHTGSMEATIKAVETVDACIGKIYNKLQKKNGTLIVTADHGNSDYMLDDENNVITSHSIYRVPFIITDKNYEVKNGKLADIAPTILSLVNIEIPEEMTGDILTISRKDKKIIFLQRLFVLLSIFALCTFLSLYYLTKSQSKNEGKQNEIIEETKNTLVNYLKEQVVTEKDGLYKENNIYVYKGQNVSNYVEYGGYRWRIVSIDEKGQMHLILDDIATILAFGNTSDYETSDIKKWMNKTSDLYSGIFASTIDTSLLVKQNDSLFRLLTLEEYQNSNLNGTYLQLEKPFWLNTKQSNDNLEYVDKDGTVGSTSVQSMLGVRPVIVMNGKVDNFSGNGTIEDPYHWIENDKVHVGDSVLYSNLRWKVVSITNESYQLVLEEPLKINDNNLFSFSTMHNKFMPTDKESLAYYLNHDFYDTLDKTYILESTWYTGEYMSEGEYDYTNIYSDSVLAHVGLVHIGDMYVDSTYLSTPSITDMIYVVKEGMIDTASVKDTYMVKPSIYISKKVSWTGTGVLEDPYVVKN